jgi:hypothetical protein
MRRVIITSQDILNPTDTKEEIYEYDINEGACFTRSFQSFGVDIKDFDQWEVLLGSLPNGDNYECRIITLRDSSIILTYKEILISNQ